MPEAAWAAGAVMEIVKTAATTLAARYLLTMFRMPNSRMYHVREPGGGPGGRHVRRPYHNDRWHRRLGDAFQCVGQGSPGHCRIGRREYLCRSSRARLGSVTPLWRTGCPILASAPWTRRYPRVGFLGGEPPHRLPYHPGGGRPGVFVVGEVHLCATNSRCQGSSVWSCRKITGQRNPGGRSRQRGHYGTVGRAQPRMRDVAGQNTASRGAIPVSRRPCWRPCGHATPAARTAKRTSRETSEKITTGILSDHATRVIVTHAVGHRHGT